MLPDPLFTLFGQGIYMYGICIGVGILVCLLVFYAYTKKKNVPSSVQDFVFFVAIAAIAFGFLAAKFYQAVYNWIENPDAGFDFAHAGVTVMGGLIGGAAMFLIAYFGIGHFYFKNGDKKNLHIKHFNDILLVAPICIVIAHAFGRIGCLMSGCCHGAFLGKQYVVGGIWMEASKGWGYYVPTQLYEALFLFALFFVLSVLYFKRCNIILPIYLAAYAVWRTFIEFFRTDPRGGSVLGLSPSQWQSVVFIVICIAILLFYYFRKIPFFFPKEQVVDEAETDNSSVAEDVALTGQDDEYSDSDATQDNDSNDNK